MLIHNLEVFNENYIIFISQVARKARYNVILDFPVFIIANDSFNFAFFQDKSKFIGRIRRIYIDEY